VRTGATGPVHEKEDPVGTVQAVGHVVLLSDSEARRALAARLSPDDGVACYGSLEEMARGEPLSRVDVLVVASRPAMNGLLLAALGRMSVDHPEIQKVAVLDGPPALPVAGFLTACDVDLVWAGTEDERLDRVVSIVEQMRERKAWIAA
jgi:hypothetical protein